MKTLDENLAAVQNRDIEIETKIQEEVVASVSQFDAIKKKLEEYTSTHTLTKGVELIISESEAEIHNYSHNSMVVKIRAKGLDYIVEGGRWEFSIFQDGDLAIEEFLYRFLKDVEGEATKK